MNVSIIVKQYIMKTINRSKLDGRYFMTFFQDHYNIVLPKVLNVRTVRNLTKYQTLTVV